MRETAKLVDDVGVQFRIFQALGVAMHAIEGERPLLVGTILRMHERQIEKGAHVGRGAIEAVKDGAAGDRPRQRVCGEGARLPTEHVARKLVEQDQQRERTLRALLPFGVLGGGGDLVEAEKMPADFVIERGVLFKPALGADVAPERDHVGGFGRIRGHGSQAAVSGSSRKARRRIFPTLDFGSSLRNSIWRGTL